MSVRPVKDESSKIKSEQIAHRFQKNRADRQNNEAHQQKGRIAVSRSAGVRTRG